MFAGGSRWACNRKFGIRQAFAWRASGPPESVGRDPVPRVSFERIVKAYGAVTVLDDLSLAIEDGDFLVLLGPSGCGKTTLLNLLAGLAEVSDGRILIGERDVTDLDPKDRGLAMVFQSYALYPTKTVRGNLRLRPVGRPAQRRRGGEARRLGRAGAADRAAARPQARAALRRPAAAGGDRAGAGQARRACCSSTSRCPTSTPSSAPRCGSRSSGCTRS